MITGGQWLRGWTEINWQVWEVTVKPPSMGDFFSVSEAVSTVTLWTKHGFRFCWQIFFAHVQKAERTVGHIFSLLLIRKITTGWVVFAHKLSTCMRPTCSKLRLFPVSTSRQYPASTLVPEETLLLDPICWPYRQYSYNITIFFCVAFLPVASLLIQNLQNSWTPVYDRHFGRFLSFLNSLSWKRWKKMCMRKSFDLILTVNACASKASRLRVSNTKDCQHAWWESKGVQSSHIWSVRRRKQSFFNKQVSIRHRKKKIFCFKWMFRPSAETLKMLNQLLVSIGVANICWDKGANWVSLSGWPEAKSGSCLERTR